MPRASQMRNPHRGASRQPWAKTPPWAPPCSLEDAAAAVRDLLAKLRGLLDSGSVTGSDLGWNELLERAGAEQRLKVTVWAEALVARDVAVPLLGLVQAVERDPSSLQPFPPPRNSSESLLACRFARELLHALYRVRAANLAAAGWRATALPASSAGAIMYRHATSGEVTETPRLAGTPWTGSLMQSLPMLAAPGLVKGEVVWAAKLVHWSPSIPTDDRNNDGPRNDSDRNSGRSDKRSKKGNPLLAGKSGSALDTMDNARTTPIEEDATAASVEAVDCSDTTTVFDVLTSAEPDDGQVSSSSEEFVALRQLTLGSWRGVNQFVETEADVSRPVGDALDAWYAVTLVGAALASFKWQEERKSPGPETEAGPSTGNQKSGDPHPPRGADAAGAEEQDNLGAGRESPPCVLVLGLGGGAITSFLNRYAPTVHVEVVELRESVTSTALRYFGLNGQLACDAKRTPSSDCSGEQGEGTEGKNGTKEAREASKSTDSDSAARPCVLYVTDACTFVNDALAAGRRFDAILIDVYSFERFPRDLCNETFFVKCKELVAPSQGIVAVNAGCADDPLHQHVLQSMQNAFQATTPESERTNQNSSSESNEISGESCSKKFSPPAGSLAFSVVAINELAVEMNNDEDRAFAQTSSSSNISSSNINSDPESSSADDARAYESAVLIGRCGSASADALLSPGAWATDNNSDLEPRNINCSTHKEGNMCSAQSTDALFQRLPFTLGDVRSRCGKLQTDLSSSRKPTQNADKNRPTPEMCTAEPPGVHHSAPAVPSVSEDSSGGSRSGALLWQEVEWKPAKQPSRRTGPVIDPQDSAWDAFGGAGSDSDSDS